MEALRLLKQCRIRRAAPVEITMANGSATKTIIASAISPEVSDGEAESCFDLEFPLTSDDNTNEEEEEEDGILFSGEEFSDDENDGNDEELKITLLNNDDENVKLSPSNELILSRNSIHFDSSTIFFQKEMEEEEEEDSSKSPVSSLKPTSKFQFLLLKLKKPKPSSGIVEKVENVEKNDEVQEKQEKSGNNFFAVYKLKVEEMKLPLVSLFTRDTNCSKEKHEKVDNVEGLDSNAGCDERKLSKEMVQKYLKIVKPLYVQLTKNYMGRIKLSSLSLPKGIGSDSSSCSATNVDVERTTEKCSQKQGNSSVNNLQAGLKIVKKHLGKSRSDSNVVSVANPGKVAVVSRSDDSMVEVQDGIQGAILHCKKSFSSCNSSGS